MSRRTLQNSFLFCFNIHINSSNKRNNLKQLLNLTNFFKKLIVIYYMGKITPSHTHIIKINAVSWQKDTDI